MEVALLSGGVLAIIISALGSMGKTSLLNQSQLASGISTWELEVSELLLAWAEKLVELTTIKKLTIVTITNLKIVVIESLLKIF